MIAKRESYGSNREHDLAIEMAKFLTQNAINKSELSFGSKSESENKLMKYFKDAYDESLKYVEGTEPDKNNC